MKIGIIGAMDEEIRTLVSLLNDVQKFDDGIATYYHGFLSGKEIYLVQSGIGKVAAAITATNLIVKYQVDQVWNTGTAGGIGDQLKVGDVVVADKLAYHDVDVTAFGYEYGQMAGGFPLYYPTDHDLTNLALKIIDHNNQQVHKGLIVSGDQFVCDRDRVLEIKNHFPEVLANEMESTAIAQVSYQFKKPLLIVRAISDSANDEASVDFEEFVNYAGKQSANVIKQMIEEVQ